MAKPNFAGRKFRGPDEWDEWANCLAEGLHGRNSWRLSILLVGVLFAQGRRTVSTWLRAAGVSPDYVDYYYFLSSVGRNAKLVSWRLLGLVLRTVPLPKRVLFLLDDSPTKRYGPKVEGADVHHNPTPGPAALMPGERGARPPKTARLPAAQENAAAAAQKEGWWFRSKARVATVLPQVNAYTDLTRFRLGPRVRGNPVAPPGAARSTPPRRAPRRGLDPLATL